MHPPRALSRVFSGLLALAAGAAVAAPLPDAGALQQQIENTLVRPQLPAPKAVEPEMAPPPPAAAGVKVTVSAFAFEGNTRFTNAQLQPAVARFVGRPLGFAELQAAAAAVADTYRAAGWVVRVFLPQQELREGGVVTLRIVEAHFGDVRLQPQKPDEALRVNAARLRGMVYAAQPQGAAVNNHAIDRALLLIDDLPGVAAGGALAAGKEEGETDLALRLANEPLLSGDVRADNTGSRSTGSKRVTGDLQLASPTGAGDSASATVLRTAGSTYGRIAYQRPVGYDGWSAGINASDMKYRLVGDFAAFGAEGSATTVGLTAAYPLLRGRQRNLSLQLAPEHKHYDNLASGITTTRYNIDVLTTSLTGNAADTFHGGGSFSGNVMLAYGRVDLGNSPNAAADAITTRTAGRYGKLYYLLARQQQLRENVSLRASLSGQVASKNLDSAEKFYIGGSSGVRAYSSSDGSGSSGTLLNLELSAHLRWYLTPSCFYDWGRVQVNRHNDYPGSAAPNGYALQGAGLALAWAHPRGASARLTWAHRIGSNPNPDPQGNDQDGTRTLNRFWLEAAYAF